MFHKAAWLLLLIVAIHLTLVSGCGDGTISYSGKVEIMKANGNVSEVRVWLGSGDSHETLTNREQVSAMISHLRSMLKDLEYAKEQMRVEEVKKPSKRPSAMLLPKKFGNATNTKASVPEPSTFVLFAIATVVIVGYSLHKKK